MVSPPAGLQKQPGSRCVYPCQRYQHEELSCSLVLRDVWNEQPARPLTKVSELQRGVFEDRAVRLDFSDHTQPVSEDAMNLTCSQQKIDSIGCAEMQRFLPERIMLQRMRRMHQGAVVFRILVCHHQGLQFNRSG